MSILEKTCKGKQQRTIDHVLLPSAAPNLAATDLGLHQRELALQLCAARDTMKNICTMTQHCTDTTWVIATYGLCVCSRDDVNLAASQRVTACSGGGFAVSCTGMLQHRSTFVAATSGLLVALHPAKPFQELWRPPCNIAPWLVAVSALQCRVLACRNTDQHL